MNKYNKILTNDFIEPSLNRQETRELQYFQKIITLTEQIKILNTEIGFLKSEIDELKDGTHKEAFKEIRTDQRIVDLTERVKSERKQKENLIKQVSETATRILRLEEKIKELENRNSVR